MPLVGIVAGRCFAGNAALLGCCDVVIATRDSSIGMGGPAMVEGGGLGVFTPEEIGPSDVQSRAGVIDVLVDDEAEAVAAARRYLAFFQGRARRAGARRPGGAARRCCRRTACASTTSARSIDALVDPDSLLELRAGFGAGIVTALARIDGRPVGADRQQPDAPRRRDRRRRRRQGGALHAALRRARLPLVSLIDTPGFMVGPEIESRGQVRHVSRMFVVARATARAGRRRSCCARRYGLGAMAMAGGRHARADRRPSPGRAASSARWASKARSSSATARSSAAAPEGAEREALRERLVAAQYEKGKAINMAATLEIDAVIDPADSRRWLASTLDVGAPARAGRGRFIDPW